MIREGCEGEGKGGGDSNQNILCPFSQLYIIGCELTPSRLSPSRRWRGMTVTISISQRKAISGGVRPGGKVEAMAWASCYL